jgi:CBS domain-containing protein
MTGELEPYRGSYLIPLFERATVADVMRPGVVSCAPDASLLTLVQTMATYRVHSVVVIGLTKDARGGDHVVWGLVSDMDVVRAAESGIEGRTATDAARTAVVTVEPTTSLAEAAKLMDQHGTAHLIVTSGSHPTGVISSLDIAAALAWGRS